MADSYNPIPIRHSVSVTDILTVYHRSCVFTGQPYPETYPFWQLTFLLSGTGTYRVGDSVYPFREGEVLFRRPDRETLLRYERNVPITYAIVSFSCFFSNGDPFPDHPVRLYGEERATLLDLIRTGVRVCGPVHASSGHVGFELHPGTPAEVPEFIGLSLERFLVMISCRLRGITLLTDESEKAGIHIARSGTAARIREYLETHTGVCVSVGDLARRFGLSETQLMKLYKREFGVSVLADHTRMKMEYARRRIAGSDVSFARVAEETGYTSQAYFSRVFRRSEGMTPTEYSRMVSKKI